MAFSDTQRKNRPYERGLPDVPQFVAHWLYQAPGKRTTEPSLVVCDDHSGHPHGHHHHRSSGPLEYPTAAIVTLIYILIAFAVCLFYNINFVYVFLVVTNVILAFVRLLIFWQLRRDSWLIWFSATNIAKAVAFFLAFMVIFRPEIADQVRLWLRVAWLTAFVFVTIGAGDMAAEFAHYLHVKRDFYDARKENE